MKLDANNNRRIIYRIAKSNLMGKKLYSFFSFLSIILSVTFVGTIILFLQGTQTAEKRMLDGMQHVMFMDVSEGQMKEIMEEYAGVVAGGMAVALILGMAFEFAFGGAGLYQLVFRFAQGIC